MLESQWVHGLAVILATVIWLAVVGTILEWVASLLHAGIHEVPDCFESPVVPLGWIGFGSMIAGVAFANCLELPFGQGVIFVAIATLLVMMISAGRLFHGSILKSFAVAAVGLAAFVVPLFLLLVVLSINV